LELRPLILNGVEQPLKVKLHSYRLDDELFHLFLKEPLLVSATGLWSFGNHSADTLVDFEPALLNEVLNRLVRGVRVDFESGCQGSNRGKRLSGLELAADESFFSGENHLIDDGFTWLELETEDRHTDTVTVVTGSVKEKIGRMRPNGRWIENTIGRLWPRIRRFSRF
jgi:hypothetical protein